MLGVTLVLIALVLGLNLAGTYTALRRDDITATARLVQVALIWLLPLVGAIVCMAAASADGVEGDRPGSSVAGHDGSSGGDGGSFSFGSDSSGDCSSCGD